MLKSDILNRATIFLNSLGYEAEMVAIPASIQEHNLCCSVDWCEKQELHLPPDQRKMYIGAGRVLISKIDDRIEYAGSAPKDWVYEFELSLQRLEEYPVLVVRYSRDKISSLKPLLQLTTPQLIRQVDPHSNIEIEGSDYELEALRSDLETAGVSCQIVHRRRKIS